jgi:gliding motility-associated-like protein
MALRYLPVNRRFLSLLAGLFALHGVQSQGCDAPLQLCGESPTAIGISALQPTLYSCIDAPYAVFLQFRTNQSTDFTGSVQVNFDAINCSSGGVPDVVQAIVVEPNQQDFCEVSEYVPVSPCVEFSAAYALNSAALLPNADYLLIVGTSHDPNVSPCAMTVTLGGAAVGINACCTANLALGQSAELTATGGDPALGYVWAPDAYISPATGPVVVVSPQTTTTYTVSGFIGSCAYSDAVTVTVGNPLDIPNSFTPNEDGFNDFWSIPDLIPYDRARLLVYDRWGQIVFRSTGYPQPWDGKRNGNPVPEGAYYYTIELNDAGLNLPTITGSISLVR